MLVRMDSDVPVPSGRTLPLTNAERKLRRKDKMAEKTKLAAIMVSNCGGKNKRWEYVKELRKHMPVDVYGACGNLRYLRISAMLVLENINQDKMYRISLQTS
jgi:glycoprotein 3-alpha-L-fucosyltransferase